MEFIGVFEPKGKPLSAMTDSEIEALASDLYDYFVERIVDQHPNPVEQ